MCLRIVLVGIVISLATLGAGGCATSHGVSTSPSPAPATPASAARPLGEPVAPVAVAGPPGITYGGGDGLGCDRRIIIQGAETEAAGIASEYRWLSTKYPGYKTKVQALTECGNHPVDKLTIETSPGKSVEIFFDISAFFSS